MLLVSDHFDVFCSIVCDDLNHSASYRSIKYRDHSDINISNFRSDVSDSLSSFNIYSEFGVCDRFEILQNILSRLYKKTSR